MTSFALVLMPQASRTPAGASKNGPPLDRQLKNQEKIGHFLPCSFLRAQVAVGLARVDRHE